MKKRFSLLLIFSLLFSGNIGFAEQVEYSTEQKITTEESSINTSESSSTEQIVIDTSSTTESRIHSTQNTTEQTDSSSNEEIISYPEISALAISEDFKMNYINKIAPRAKIHAENNGLYASVMIAQSILESDWGRSELASEPNNNHFGIKGDYKDQFVMKKTKEWDKNKNDYVVVEAQFRKYPNVDTSIKDNAEKLRNGLQWDSSYYSGTWIENTQSYRDATKALTGKYATDPIYGEKLNNLIVTYNLVQYDSNYNEPEKEVITLISKDVSIKPDASNNVHSRPYPYEGFIITGTTKPHQGKQVHLSQQAKTSVGTYYLADGIGWINAVAFTNSLDTVTKTTFNRYAKVDPNKSYYFYKEPYNTKGAYRLDNKSSSLAGKDVQITQQATNNRTKEVFYLVKDIGWLPKTAFSVIYDQENIKLISKDVSIKPDANNNIHSRPYPYVGYKITGSTKSHQGKQVHLSQEAKTSNGTYYLADGIGWIRSNAFTTNLDTLTKKTTNQIAKVNGSKSYYFYKEPYNTKGAYRTGLNSKDFANKEVNLSYVATNNRTKEIFYFVDGQGWLPKAAFSIVYDQENIKSISKDLTVTSSAKNNVHSRPYPYYGFKIIGTTTPYQGKQVHISQEAVTSNGTYYLADGIGWVRSNAFTTKLDSVTKTTFNRDAKVLNKNYFFYKEPYNTKGSERTGKSSSSIKNTDVVLTQKAVSKNNGNIYYHVKNYGWIDQKALLIYDIPKYESINITETVLPNTDFNVHTQPYPYKGFKVIGTTNSMKMNNKQFNIKRQAHTSNGIYYEVPNYGWVNKKAFSSDVEKYKKVQNLLDTKYRSGNYSVYVKSLKSGSSAGIYQDTRYTAASTGKLPAIYYTQKRYNDKSLNPNTKFVYNDSINQMKESYGRGGAGILQNKPFGGSYSIDTILNWTIYYSDNQGANFLGYYAANKYSNSMKQEISQIIGRPWDSPFSISARENAKLMEAIYYQGGNANKYLQNTSFDNQRIPKYLPVKVGHKIGDVFDYRHDVAIVYAKEPYILSVMTKNYQSYESISQLSLDIYNILK